LVPRCQSHDEDRAVALELSDKLEALALDTKRSKC
jgi:hypothetical protein